MTKIIVREIATQETVHSIDVTGKSEAQIDRIEMGLARNFDFTRYMFGTDE